MQAAIVRCGVLAALLISAGPLAAARAQSFGPTAATAVPTAAVWPAARPARPNMHAWLMHCVPYPYAETLRGKGELRYVACTSTPLVPLVPGVILGVILRH